MFAKWFAYRRTIQFDHRLAKIYDLKKAGDLSAEDFEKLITIAKVEARIIKYDRFLKNAVNKAKVKIATS